MPKEQNTCKSDGCENERRYSKTRKRHTSSYCRKCIIRAYRKKFPIKASYDLLKSNAKKRKIEFTITLEYFTKFCFKTQYIQKKGKTSESYSVDRINSELGYVPGNLQVLTLAKNTIKMHLDRRLAKEEGIYKVVKIINRPQKRGNDEVVPF